MFLSAFPLAICFYLMYQPPDGLSEQGLFLWFTATMVGVRLAKTFYAVPHSALGAELTDDYDERTSVFGWNWIVGVLGAVALGVFVMFVIFPSNDDYQNGLLDPDRYLFLALFGAVFCFAAIMFCTFATADQIPFLHGEATVAERTTSYYRRFFRDTLVNLRALVVNPSYLSVCLCWLILAISGGVIEIVAPYTFVYAFDFSTEQIALRDIVRVPGVLVVVVVAAWLTRLMDKKNTVISMIAVTAFLIGLPYCLRLLGWFPDNGSIWLLVAFFGIWGLGFITLPVVPVVIDSQLVDVADEHELNTGNRAEGVIFAVRTFAIKLTTGAGRTDRRLRPRDHRVPAGRRDAGSLTRGHRRAAVHDGAALLHHRLRGAWLRLHVPHRQGPPRGDPAGTRGAAREQLTPAPSPMAFVLA